MKRTILMLVSLLVTTFMWSQSNEDRLQQLLEDDPETLNAIIAADANVQAAVFEAAAQPEALAQLQRIQDRSRAEFEVAVKPYSQETQQIFWDLTRYPKLVSRLANEGKGSESAIREVLRDYPEVIHPRAKEASKYYYNLLVKIDELERRTNREFSSFLEDYPRSTQDAFRKLIDNPEALSALGQNKNTTERLAELYEDDSNWTLRRFNELNRDSAAGNTQQLQDWKSGLESDPEAASEFAESAQAYAKEYGYDDEYYGEDSEDQVYYEDNRYENNRSERVVVRNHYYYNYPYWFGYPRWYRAPRWRPVPVWYDYGFHYRPGRPIVIVSMPSFYFVNWYFYRPQHHYRYARLSNCFVDYYYRNPRSCNTVVIGVNHWKYRNRAVIGDDWLRDRNNRVERLREFGQFEQERRTYNRDNRSREVSQRDYLEKNDTKYANLTRVAPRNADRNTFPEREKTVETPRRSDAVTQPRTREEAHQRERTEQTPERTITTPRRTESTSEPRTRSREEVQPRENPNQNIPETTPRRSTQPEQTRRREEVQPRENPERNVPETTPRRSTQPEQTRRREEPTQQQEMQQREPVRREQPRTIERNPEPQQRQSQERTREPQVERSRSSEPGRSVERPRNNSSGNAPEKSSATKKEEAPRKRGKG